MNICRLILSRTMVVIFCIFYSLGAQTRIVQASDYPYPIQDPLFSTLLSGVNLERLNFKTIVLEPLPERQNVPLLEGRNQVEINLFIQVNQQAPVVFIIPGIGGSAGSRSALQIAKQMYKLGYTAITLPNAMSWKYALAVSKSGAPGYLPSDSVEYYDFLKTIRSYLQQKEKITPTSYSLIGYSYGGLLVAYLEYVDKQKVEFNFKKIVAINPAIDLQHGIRSIDKFYAAGSRFTDEYKTYLLGAVQNAGIELLRVPFTLENMLRILHPFTSLQNDDKEWLIGASFRYDLRDLIFVSQQINDVGVLKSPVSFFHMNAREAESLELTFFDYIEKIVIPTIPGNLKDNLNCQNLLSQSGMYPLMDLLAKDKKIYIQENADDFLLLPGDTILLEEKMEDRLYLYPFGGHIGNLWFKQNIDDLNSIMSL